MLHIDALAALMAEKDLTQYHQSLEQWLAKRQVLIQELIGKKDQSGLVRLQKEMLVELSFFQSELKKMQAAIRGIANVKEYTQID